jgi:eukaryotic-like serine/threonine-protein kinase
MTPTSPHTPAREAPQDAGNDASFAATVAEELFAEGEEGDSVLPAQGGDDDALGSLPTLSHAGRYLLKHQLGSGGLGAVYAAIDPLLSRTIAVKMLRVAGLAAEERASLESLLLAEARASAGLAHANIVTVYDAGLAAEGVYIAMERLQGKDLRQLLADGWRPDAVQAARIAKRLTDALAYAHSKGVIHCDVKPANVFMVGRTQPKLLDFGIARVTRRKGHEASRGKAPGDAAANAVDDAVDIDTGALGTPTAELGSPYYVCPEQLRGEDIDARADVYGVGVVLYEMLIGRRAFAGDSLAAIRHAVLEGVVPSAHSVDPAIDAALSDIVARAMARKPGERHRSARQLSRALRTWISEETNGVAHESTRHAWGGWAWAAGGAIAVGVIAAVTLGTSRGDEAPPSSVAAVGVAARPASSSPARPSTVASAATAITAVTAERAAPAAEAAAVTATVVAASAAANEPAGAAKASSPSKPRPDSARAKKEKAAVKPAPVVEPTPVAAPAPGTLQLAVTPWGQVEVDGRAMGTTPPLTRLSLAAGTHQIVVRNGDFAAFSTSVTVSEDKPVTVRHRFE